MDFAFPDIWLAVEADGAVYHDGRHRERDRTRDGILRLAGRTVKRFRGSTIPGKAAGGVYVVRREWSRAGR